MTLLLSLFSAGFNLTRAEETFPFQVEAIDNNINIRSDSTVNSEIICKANKGDYLTVISEAYGWYKVVLPKNSPAFIKDNLITPIDTKTVKVTKENVNIRLRPAYSSPIIGRAKKDQVLSLKS